MAMRHFVDRIMAARDCPEVYLLAAVPNRTGRLYDFFSSDASDDAGPWMSAEVIVVNHKPSFSEPLSQKVVTELRRAFSHGERLGRFEIRWR
jgi:hypothetical protein